VDQGPSGRASLTTVGVSPFAVSGTLMLGGVRPVRACVAHKRSISFICGKEKHFQQFHAK
jgi:hypothetical protein